MSRKRDKKYLGVIARLPSVISLKSPCEVCHVRYGDASQGKPPTGIGEKPDDRWTLPLTPEEHRLGEDAQHSGSEREWWQNRGIDPIKLCNELHNAWLAGEDIEALTQIVVGSRLCGE